MKVIGINGSPNEKSNTNFLLSKSLEAIEDEGEKTQLIKVTEVLDDLEVPFCEHCSSPCNQSCYKGTKLEAAYNKLVDADGIIISSPVYFGTVSGQLKAFWDMSRAIRSEHQLVNTIGASISVGASTYGGQETTNSAIQDMMLVQGMTIVGNGLKDVDVGHQAAAGKEEVFEDQRAIRHAINTGKRVVQTIEKYKN